MAHSSRSSSGPEEMRLEALRRANLVLGGGDADEDANDDASGAIKNDQADEEPAGEGNGGNRSVFKLGWSAIGISLLVATIAAVLSLPATMLLDQLFWYRQKLGKKRRHGKFEHSREMQLMTAAAISSALDTVGSHRAFFEWHSAIELLRVEALQARVSPTPNRPFPPDSVACP